MEIAHHDRVVSEVQQFRLLVERFGTFPGDIQRFLKAFCQEANLAAGEHCQAAPNQRGQQNGHHQNSGPALNHALALSAQLHFGCGEGVVVRTDRSPQLVALQAALVTTLSRIGGRQAPAAQIDRVLGLLLPLVKMAVDGCQTGLLLRIRRRPAD